MLALTQMPSKDAVVELKVMNEDSLNIVDLAVKKTTDPL